MNARARVGGYFAAAMERSGGSVLEIAIARVVGFLVAGDTGRGVELSTATIQTFCVDRGASSRAWYPEPHAPAYGTVARVLETLRGIGVLTWRKAHNSRWHDEIPSDAIRAVRQADGTYLLPPRRLSLVGWVATLATRTVASVAASIGSDARAPLACGARPPRLDPPPDSKSADESPRPVSIESAPAAAPPPADAPPGEESYFDRVARKYLDAQRDRK